MKCDYDKILEKSAERTVEIFEAKKNYISNVTIKLADSHTDPKTYWTLLNRLLYYKKIPAIPPPLVDGKLVSNLYQKSNIFNNFFASIYTPIKHSSTLPSFSYYCLLACLLMFLPTFTLVSYFFFLYRPLSLSLCMVFNAILSTIDEALLINPSVNVFVFRDKRTG